MRLSAVILMILCLALPLAYGQTTLKPGEVAVMQLQITKTKNYFSVALTDKKLVRDSDKKITNLTSWNEGDCVCLLLDGNNKVIDTLVLVQPLAQHYEYPNDDGSLGSTIVDLESNNLLLRFNYDESIKSLRVAAVKHNGRLKTLETFPL